MTTQSLNQLRTAQAHLAARGVVFATGLSDDEVRAIEERFSFCFPPDLRVFLQWGVPLGTGFPDWRDEDEILSEKLRWPVDGICFDIRNRVFWWPDWGMRPQVDQEAEKIATARLRLLPPLIPIFGHSYLPSEPNEEANPVFSIHNADVIHRGRNLAEYLLWVHHDSSDTAIEDRYPVYDPGYKVIPFWSEMARHNYS